MISVECLERGIPAAKVSLSGEHFLTVEDIKPLFNWTEDDVWVIRTGLTEIAFVHWLETMAIYRYNCLTQLFKNNKTATLILTPLEAFMPVESWLVELTAYISKKNPEARINIIQIQGVDQFRGQARRLFPNNR